MVLGWCLHCPCSSTGTKKARAQASTSHTATSAQSRSVLWSLVQCNPAQSEISSPPEESFFVGLPAWARIQTRAVWVHPHGTVPRLVSPAKAQGHTEEKEHPSQLWRACSALAAPPIPPQARRSPWPPTCTSTLLLLHPSRIHRVWV